MITYPALFPCRYLPALLLIFGTLASPAAPRLPEKDLRAAPPRTLNTLRTFPGIKSKAEWESRARDIRDQVLVSCGLWPMPDKTPLQAVIKNKVVHGDYSIEQVYLQTYPGFYLAGNLYRPVGKGDGPFPGILNPHGHWRNGRLEDQVLGSIRARCINFAKQGMVAFAYDMVGYNDTAQVNHQFAADPTNQLWNISLMGLQTWNSIRALDFLESLPGVDARRLACTGASGGGTQTFMLGAVDSRLAAQAPNVMVSHSMQGGCLCENAPGLRVEHSNMELAAAAAPRPQILVAATGDWTKKTPEVEGPSIEKIYRLLGATDRFQTVRFDFEHNYNQTSREAVYAFFGRWLLKHSDPGSLKEHAYEKIPNAELLAFPDKKLPPDALNETQLVDSMIRLARAQWEAHRPSKTSLAAFKRTWLRAWEPTLQLDTPSVIIEAAGVVEGKGYTMSRLALGRPGHGDRLPALLFTPSKDDLQFLAVLVHPEGKAAFLDQGGKPAGIAKRLLAERHSVLLLDTYLTGELANAEVARTRKPFTNYFSTYNRTDLQERVQDLVTASVFAQRHSKGRRVALVGIGRAGLWALLAAPAADAVAADCAGLDLTSDQALMDPDLFAPGLRRLGGFAGVAALAAPNPLFLHNTGEKFGTGILNDAYEASKSRSALRIAKTPLSDDSIVAWITEQKSRLRRAAR
jgi:dienelactone hydrolase